MARRGSDKRIEKIKRYLALVPEKPIKRSYNEVPSDVAVEWCFAILGNHYRKLCQVLRQLPENVRTLINVNRPEWIAADNHLDALAAAGKVAELIDAIEAHEVRIENHITQIQSLRKETDGLSNSTGADRAGTARPV